MVSFQILYNMHKVCQSWGNGLFRMIINKVIQKSNSKKINDTVHIFLEVCKTLTGTNRTTNKQTYIGSLKLCK